MESTGIAGKIQVSQATADRLIAKSKGHWLTPREDTIEVYGKGKQNFFGSQFTYDYLLSK